MYEKDLREAIAECQGQRNPDANTCIKLAAYLTILKEIYPDEKHDPVFHQMTSGGNDNEYDSGTEFSSVCKGRPISDILPVIDELMTTLQVLYPRLYNGVMNKL